MLTIAPRIRQLVETDQTAKICPEAYEGVDTRDLVEPPSRMVLMVGLIFLCFTLAVLHFLRFDVPQSSKGPQRFPRPNLPRRSPAKQK